MTTTVTTVTPLLTTVTPTVDTTVPNSLRPSVLTIRLFDRTGPKNGRNGPKMVEMVRKNHEKS